jgi:O-antigen/teichoic acid export membrane protein
LRKLALRGSLFELVGFGSAQVVRFGSNLLLTRLLFPHAFGLVAILNIVNMGLQLLSDIGIEPAVVQSERGEEPKFLNTAWTMQVLRGAILYAIALLLAWPLARLYREPQLIPVLMIGCFSVFITGLHSTSMYTLRRRLQIGKLTIIELTGQIAAVVVMIPWAYFSRSVWALVGGSLVFAGARVSASYMFSTGHRHRLEVDADSRKALADFGKWIFGSSALYFVARQGDRLLVGRLLGVADLGIYSIAVLLNEAMSTVLQRVTSGVLFPAFSRLREAGEDRLRSAYYRARLALDGILLPALGALTMLAPSIVHILYDQRYAAAGWIFQYLTIRLALMVVLGPPESLLIALGQTKYALFVNVGRTIWVLIGIPVGWYLFGMQGLVIAAALGELPAAAALWPACHARGFLRGWVELRAVGFYTVGVAAGLLLRLLLPR